MNFSFEKWRPNAGWHPKLVPSGEFSYFWLHQKNWHPKILSETVFFLHFQAICVMLMRGSCTKMFEFGWNPSIATSFQVLISIWESLLNAKNHNFSMFLRESNVRIFKCFSLFSTMCMHAQACIAGQNTQQPC